MEALTAAVTAVNGIVWGIPMLVLIFGTGLFLQAGLRFMPIAKLGFGFRLLWSGRGTEAGEGEIAAVVGADWLAHDLADDGAYRDSGGDL